MNAPDDPRRKGLGQTQAGAGPSWRLTLDRVLLAERRAIWGREASGMPFPDAFVRQHRPAALCLSGGGIRSAAFGLGVVQGLAQRGLLGQFHYLSTVSGGGYIGAWLTRWIHDAERGVAEVQEALGTPGTEEPPQVRRLRERTNYITPRTGLASADTWTAATILARNLILNWLIFLPLLLLVGGAFNLYRDAFAGLSAIPASAWSWAALLAMSALLAWAVGNATHWLPTQAILRGGMAAEAYARPALLHRRIVMPMLAWSLLLPLAVAPAISPRTGLGVLPGAWAAVLPGAWGAVLAAGSLFLGTVLGYAIGYLRAAKGDPRAHFERNILVWVCASAVSAAVFGAGMSVAMRLLASDAAGVEWAAPWQPAWDAAAWRDVRLGLLVALIPLWATVSHVLLATVYTGFRQIPPSVARAQDGPDGMLARLWSRLPSMRGRRGARPRARPAADLDREWLARLSAAQLQAPALWALLALACLVLPVLVFRLSGQTIQAASAIIASASGLVAVLGGRSGLTGFMAGRVAARRGGAILSVVLPAAAIVAAAGLLAIAAHAVAALSGLVGRTLLGGPSLASASLVAAGLVVLLLLASRNLKVNRFSLHGFYRNRLVRAFLGAARGDGQRQADPFTDFDAEDNIRMRQAWKNPPRGEVGALFPVVNLALNVTGGNRLAWQERKAASFTVTPFACGWTDPLRNGSPAQAGAYAIAGRYGGNEADLGMAGAGISLGTAMTISGAAASPNMGYHSSPPTAFLMTLFNVRLGAWLPNPAHDHTADDLRASSPGNAILPLLREMAGLATDDAPYGYLSDGGHFDNLGLYEMVRRRCALILVSDAAQDAECRFKDLGMAARKIQVDQGVRIDIDTLRIVARGKADKGSLAFAVGKLVYPDAPEGRLLYLRPSYLPATMPIGVRAYAEANPDFPHEPTADQWFSESQFESYRALGEALLHSIDRSGDRPVSLAEFFDRAELAGR